MLKFSSVTMVAAAFLSACSTLPQARDTPRVVVLGQLSNQTYQHIDDPDDMLGHGCITADMKVVRVIKGRLNQRKLTVQYVAHTYFREDKPLEFRLKRNDSGKYLICAPKGQSGIKCD